MLTIKHNIQTTVHYIEISLCDICHNVMKILFTLPKFIDFIFASSKGKRKVKRQISFRAEY